MRSRHRMIPVSYTHLDVYKRQGLRAIMEGVIMDLMYEIPSQTDVSECLITKDVVEGCLLYTSRCV